MAKRGITRDYLVDLAVELIGEKGINNFSLKILAERAKIRTASLYNHIDSLNELYYEVGLRVRATMSRLLAAALANRQRDEAIFAMTETYRDFAKQNPELYKMIMMIPTVAQGLKTPSPMMEMLPETREVLRQFGLTEEQAIYWQRILRATMHGFIAHETAGYFDYADIDRDKCYRLAIFNIVSALKLIEQENKRAKGLAKCYSRLT